LLKHPAVHRVEHELELDRLVEERPLLGRERVHPAEVAREIGAPGGERLAESGSAVDQPVVLPSVRTARFKVRSPCL